MNGFQYHAVYRCRVGMVCACHCWFTLFLVSHECSCRRCAPHMDVLWWESSALPPVWCRAGQAGAIFHWIYLATVTHCFYILCSGVVRGRICLGVFSLSQGSDRRVENCWRGGCHLSFVWNLITCCVICFTQSMQVVILYFFSWYSRIWSF